jgi:hypothetical protein
MAELYLVSSLSRKMAMSDDMSIDSKTVASIQSDFTLSSFPQPPETLSSEMAGNLQMNRQTGLSDLVRPPPTPKTSSKLKTRRTLSFMSLRASGDSSVFGTDVRTDKTLADGTHYDVTSFIGGGCILYRTAQLGKYNAVDRTVHVSRSERGLSGNRKKTGSFGDNFAGHQRGRRTAYSGCPSTIVTVTFRH